MAHTTLSDLATSALLVVGVLFLFNTGHVALADRQCYYTTNGTCVNMDNHVCPAGHKLESRGCGFKETCCFPYVQNEPEFVYGNEKCGVSSKNWKSKIVGGDDAYISEYPWTVSIQKSNQPVCGGSIISDRWILTAAHCVTTNADTITVVVGTSKTNIGWGDYQRRHQVTNILSHGSFNERAAGLGYDIAMLKLSKPLSLGGTLVRSVCLPEPNEDFTDRVCIASGWGYTHEPKGQAVSSGGSPTLRQAQIPIISRSRCVYFTGTRSVHTMCAGYRSGGVDTCQGDSGGPLVCQGRDGVWKQAGIVSTGRGCGRYNEMGIYTQVSAFTAWVEYIKKKYA